MWTRVPTAKALPCRPIARRGHLSSQDAHTIVCAHSRRAAGQGVHHAYGVCLVAAGRNIVGVHPVDSGSLAIGRPGRRGDESRPKDERDNSMDHVLIDAGQSNRFDLVPSLLAHLARESFHDRLPGIKYAAGWLPMAIIATLDHEDFASVI